MGRPGENQRSIAQKKELSGAEKQRKRRLQCKESAKMSQAMKKFIHPKPEALSPRIDNSNIQVDNPVEIIEEPTNSNTLEVNIQASDGSSTRESSSNVSQEPPPAVIMDPKDPSTWEFPLTSQNTSVILRNGPQQQLLNTYPKRNGFHFNNNQLSAKNSKNEVMKRDWILYSQTTNSIFCFPCCMFNEKRSSWSNYGIDSIGFNDYQNLSKRVRSHETTHHHFDSTVKWRTFEAQKMNNTLLDAQFEVELCKEKGFWVEVLRGILDAVIYLARNNLAFQGCTTDMNDRGCGNFLSLISLLSKHNATLAKHVSRITKSSVSYLSPRIQNEFISISGEAVRRSILQEIRDRKYYSIMFDATPDTSRKEQISQIIRTVKVDKSGCEISENFIDFIHCDEKTGLALSIVILAKLEKDGLDVTLCRGQGYDNGSNMSGKEKGVQSRIQEANPNADYYPCAAHSLNLVGHNAASHCLPAKLLLGQVQNLFVFFSSSTIRWNFLRESVTKCLKGHSSTRWASKANAVSALFQQFGDIGHCLTEMITCRAMDFNNQTVADANSRLADIWNFKFMLGLCVWERILFRIHICNTAFQSKTIDIQDAARHLEGLIAWLTEFEINGFETAIRDTTVKAMQLNIAEESGFNYRLTRNVPPPRFRGNDERIDIPSNLTNLERFKIDFFNKLMKELLSEFKDRFRAIKVSSDMFSFLWGPKLLSSSEKDILESVNSVVQKYTQDFDTQRFIREVSFLRTAVTPFLSLGMDLTATSAMDILNILTKYHLDGQFNNCHTALRIFLTLPVSVASNERSFSKLKLIKNYLRSSMSQDRLSNLGILSIEHEKVEKLNFDEIIQEFADKKCRKVNI